jgi:cell division protein FtsL
MNWLKILVGLSAIIIAGCAAYFSVTGLGVLFAGASISVMVMASSLELAKLVAATYLKQKWDEIGGFNKWYLTASVALLMLITSAGIFGYLSNAFQAQSLQLQQVDREIAVHQTKIDQNTTQIEQLSTQITEFNTNQGKIIDGGKVNSRLLRSIDNRDKEIAKINNKISDLQTQNAGETEKINEIKIKNLDLEKEVGGFRFVAEAFGMELKNVVKFFIFLIVIVFDPLAVALIIAFNGLIETKKQKQSRLLGEMMKNDQKLGLYEVYGDTKEDIVENISQNIEDSGKNSPIEEEIPIIEENIPNLQWEEFMHPDFPWAKKQLWINNPKAVQYWISTKRGTEKDYSKMLNEEENTKTY